MSQYPRLIESSLASLEPIAKRTNPAAMEHTGHWWPRECAVAARHRLVGRRPTNLGFRPIVGIVFVGE